MADSSTLRPKEPWDRRRDEPAKAYGAFEHYLNLPPGQRTLKAAYRLHTGNDNAAGPSDNFKGWAKRHNWEERARAYDDAKARARVEGELTGIRSHWEEIAAQRERAQTQLFELMGLAYEKAREIYEMELTRDNYSMAHAVQMTKLVLEGYKLLIELEKLHSAHERDRWTEEDERAVAEILEALDSEEAQELFEESRRREQEAEQAELRAAEFFEEQRRKQKDNEEDEGPEGTGDS